MNASAPQPLVFHANRPGQDVAARLAKVVSGAVMADAASCARYATDASIYQVQPLAILVPASDDDVRAATEVCTALGVPIIARGAGSSQCGQTVGAGLVIDHSKHLNRVVAFDAAAQTVTVEPGIVLDELNDWLRKHGLWFPVDVSKSAQATLGGMAGNNSCGSRSIVYGNMVHNVLGLSAWLADGSQFEFGPVPDDLSRLTGANGYVDLVKKVRAIAVRETEEIAHRYPKVLRRVG